MTSTQKNIAGILNAAFVEKFPKDAARHLESINATNAATFLSEHSIHSVCQVWFYLTPLNKIDIFINLPIDTAKNLLLQMDIAPISALLLNLEREERERYLKLLPPNYTNLIKEHITYPHDVAGYLMDKVTYSYHDSMLVGEILKHIKKLKWAASSYLYIVDHEMKLCGRISILKLLTADDEQTLSSLGIASSAYLTALAPRAEIVETFETSKLDALPVVDAHGHMIGILYSNKLIETIKEEAISDIQTMVGASPDEKALSSSTFSVKKRLPWLLVNLFTAFLAASVVGMFEDLIAKVTVLAILLPVVAGQSGNAGAQALAVTMRGLTLREVNLTQWLKIVSKEMFVGLMSGSVIAIGCGLVVYFWEHNSGISLILTLSMILSITIACISGALVPIVLKKIGLDPAQSSSIILTTITDITGFFSFLGIATLLSRFL